MKILLALILFGIIVACSSKPLQTNSAELNLAPDYSDPMLPSSSYKKIESNPSAVMNDALALESAIIISGVYSRIELIEYEDFLIKKILPNTKFNIIKDEVIEHNKRYYNIIDIEYPAELNIQKLYFDVTELENNL